MIATHHLAYAGVLLVFLAGAAVVAISAFLFFGTGKLRQELHSRALRTCAGG